MNVRSFPEDRAAIRAATSPTYHLSRLTRSTCAVGCRDLCRDDDGSCLSHRRKRAPGSGHGDRQLLRHAEITSRDRAEEPPSRISFRVADEADRRVDAAAADERLRLRAPRAQDRGPCVPHGSASSAHGLRTEGFGASPWASEPLAESPLRDSQAVMDAPYARGLSKAPVVRRCPIRRHAGLAPNPGGAAVRGVSRRSKAASRPARRKVLFARTSVERANGAVHSKSAPAMDADGRCVNPGGDITTSVVSSSQTASSPGQTPSRRHTEPARSITRMRASPCGCATCSQPTPAWNTSPDSSSVRRSSPSCR
jgi:hypothetical protein